MQKTNLAAEGLAEMIRDGLAEEGHDVQVHPDPEIGWDVAVTSANELGTRQVPLLVGRFQKYAVRSVFPTLHQVRRTSLVFDFLDGNRSSVMSAGECTVERYEQDSNVFILLIANEREL